jgi:hypothetical protein
MPLKGIPQYKEIRGKTYSLVINHGRMKEAKRHLNYLLAHGYEAKIVRQKSSDGITVLSMYARRAS